MREFAIFLVSALMSGALVVALRGYAPSLGLIDHPGGRKTHEMPVPVVGGLAMYLALAPFVLASGHRDAFAFVIALGFVTLVGALDDRVQLSAKLRLALEVVAAVILLTGGVAVNYLGNLIGFGPMGTSFAAPVFTIVCVIGLINGFNMADGLDGLAGSLAFVACIFFTGVALATGQGEVALVGIAALGVLVGFLAFNMRSRIRRRAAVFMGDAGSMVLGILFAWFAIELAGNKPSLLTPIGAVWILAVPLLDMGSVMAYRISHGTSPFHADRRHFHYMLVDRGMPVSKAVALLVGAASICGAIGLGFPLLGIPEWAMFWAFLAVLGLTWRWISSADRAPRATARAPAASRAAPNVNEPMVIE
jgi:UDP-GlcNAc:undecaprenyl-phosphate/decaprenyl-phosphate GlcNAc-1-phosphate transferase